MTKVRKRYYSGIRFDWMFVRELRFADNPSSYEHERLETLQADLHLDSDVSEDGRKARVRLGLTVRPTPGQKALFQALSAKIEAGFSVPEENEPSVSMDEFVRLQAPAILLPFVRQEIALATSQSRLGQVLLAPINLTKVTEEIRKSKAEQAADESSPATQAPETSA